MAPEHWATQSPVTDPGEASSAIDALDASLPSLRFASSQLVFHYRAGDFAQAGVPTTRMTEIDTRFAAPMFARILAATPDDPGPDSGAAPPSPSPLSRARPGADRTVGCCRDAAVLLAALARRKGVPARVRVGFAAYLRRGWWLDHVVTEVWDAAARRWRLVEAEVEDDVVLERGPEDGGGGGGVDYLDLRRGVDFLAGGEAWMAARRGEVDARRFVVAPELAMPLLRGWPYLAHNVAHDLAALNKTEMLLWDTWGFQDHLDDGVTAEDEALLDEVSPALADVDITPDKVAELAARDEFLIPTTVTSADPLGGPLRQVDVTKVLGVA